ncbi:MFS general substrate transporter [Rickenella mellea]|uniref:MFS general substrate transporter n=1 Tax=Rickenella mellea TaxID=50990 RepID=A0A4Y7PTS2_9AGAM|nr:MFS general substrate transporter [Rickenella mellea]
MGSSGLLQSPAPGLLSAQRLTTLISSLVVSLSSGTNYVTYAPQLGSQLRMTHTQLNIIGLAGNVGVYSSAPLLGKLVDRRGPKPLLAGAFIFLLIGYSGIRHFYDSAAIPPAELHSSRESDESRISTFGFCILVLCSFLTGAGGNGGLTSGMNATAKSFPDQMRASATALVISGFGLSAFFFSTIAHLFFPGDTSALLLLLALGTSFPMIMGFFLVRPIPLPSSSDAHHNHSHLPPAERRMSFADAPSDGFSRTVVGDAMAYEHVAADSHTSLLSNHHHHPDQHHSEQEDDEEEGAEGFTHRDHGSPNQDRTDGSVELATSPPPNARRHRSLSRVAGHRSSSRVIEVMNDISGKALFMCRDFWLLFFVLSFFSGTGLMYINNVGSISQALLAKDKPNYNEKEASKWQNMQVSTISIANCLGRILIGLCADLVKNKLNAPRSFCMTLVSLLFIFSQLFATHVESVSSLWKASALLGLAYGGLFGLFPTLVIEWFGLSHFSENWGYVSISPMFGGNLFSLAFGINLDKHATPSPSTPLPPSLAPPSSSATNVSLFTRAGLPSTQQCLDGRQCYTSSLHMTTFACSLALILSIYAGYRDMKRMRVQLGRSTRGPPDVIWDEDEEEG